MDSDNKKPSQLTQVTSLSDSDLFIVSIDVPSAPKTRAIKKSAAISAGGIMPNDLINGGMKIWQRQLLPATLTAHADDTYFADGWIVLTNGGATDIQAARTTGDTNSQYAAQLKQTNATAKYFGATQIIKSSKSIPHRSRSSRFQFRLKASTNTNFRAAIVEWTGTADTVTSDIVLDWTNVTYTAGSFFLASNLTITAVSSALAATTSYADFSITGTLGATCNNVIVFVWAEGTVAQNVTFDITQAGFYDGTSSQVWIDSDDQLKCEEFCYRLVNDGSGSNFVCAGFRVGTTDMYMQPALHVPMRITPSLVHNVTGWDADSAPTTTLIGGILSTTDGYVTISGAMTLSYTGTSSFPTIQLRAGTSFGGSGGNPVTFRIGPDAYIYLEAGL